ncbi:MAG: ATPase [Bacteroidota bacterium]|nr:ATPase [Bacteroidota bacterium]MDX5431171.1 ATPase [Bacteroidota bacterium]MDX5469910.1 ATPase [Bacteroidota bacterium]
MFGLRQKINLFIFENKYLIQRLMGWVVAISSIVTIASLIYYHGYPHTPEEQKVLLDINRAFFAVFILNYLVRLFFTLERIAYIRSTWVELSMLVLVILNFISYQVFKFPAIARLFEAMGWEGFEPYYVFFIQLYLLLLIVMEVVKSVQLLGKLKLRPTTIFLMSFLLLIGGGTFLLQLPALSDGSQQLRWIDALFTATSASCVTGLIVVDTATFFNTKGQLIILLLFQIGGLGIISFATFFATFMKKGMGLKQQSMLKELFDNESLLGTVSLLRKVVFYTVTIEVISTLLIYSFWGDYPFRSEGQKVFYSVFHAISAFCNAGFSLFTNGLAEIGIANNYVLHVFIAVTIFFGGLGFPALRDIFEVNNVRERLSKPWKKWKLSTQIAFYGSLILIAFGTLTFYLLEKDGVLEGNSPMPAFVTSLFQSVTTRTAGFNTVDFSLLSAPTLIIFIFLMFIGASSGSTGGGIKTSTFVVIFSAILATVTGKKDVTLGRRTISQELIYKAFSVFIFSATFIFIAVVLLAIAEPGIEITRLVFEEVSAFATVGLSTGITAGLSDFSKGILIVSMFVGRIGILSLAFSLSVPTRTTAYHYPKSHIMIG